MSVLRAVAGVVAARRVSVPTIYAARGFSTGNYYVSANGDDGDVNGYAASMGISFESLADVSSKYVFDHWTRGSVGFGWRWDAGNLYFRSTSAAGSTVASPSRTIIAGELNKWGVATGVYDQVAGLVRHYFNGVQVGAGTAVTGHLPGTAKCSYGANEIGSNPAINTALFGAATWVGGAPSAAQVLAHYQACVAACDMVSTMGTLTPKHFYSVKQSQVGGNPPAPLTDTVAGLNLVKTGSPLLTTVTNPVWI